MTNRSTKSTIYSVDFQTEYDIIYFGQRRRL